MLPPLTWSSCWCSLRSMFSDPYLAICRSWELWHGRISQLDINGLKNVVRQDSSLASSCAGRRLSRSRDACTVIRVLVTLLYTGSSMSPRIMRHIHRLGCC